MQLSKLIEDTFVKLLITLFEKLPAVAVLLGITTEEIKQLGQDAALMQYVINGQKSIQDHAQQWTAYKNNLRYGNKNNQPLGVAPSWTPAAAPENGGLPNIADRVGKMIQQIKASKNYTDAIGQNLGIATLNTGGVSKADLDAMKPVLKVHLVAGQPIVEWKKGDADGVEIHKSVELGAFHFLEMDLRPHFADKSPLPPAGKSEVWKYKAIYRLRDERIGQWSDEVSISVLG